MPTHICRFKVISLECAAMPHGQSYLIRYVRGDTDRSTPSFQAFNGVVDFSRMPEGAAILHFKKNKGTTFDLNRNAPYAPKYIQFRVDEYHQRAARRPVGETQIDCALTVDPAGNEGSKIVTAKFLMYGTTAKIRVAVLVYRQGTLPLSFDSLILANNSAASGKDSTEKKADENVKVMAREEATTLLISLEALQDRRNRDGTSVSSFPELDKELQMLEAKRKMMVGSEGLASQVVRARCHDCITAQFHDLRVRYRANFIGTTAAYLRQMALAHKYSPEDLKTNSSTVAGKEQLRININRVEERIDQLRHEVRNLEVEQERLQASENIDDVVNEIIANTEKFDTISGQIKVLELSRVAMKKTLDNASAIETPQSTNPLDLEINDIRSRIDGLETKVPVLQQKINHMNSVAITHVVTWARSKNPSEADAVATQSVDELFDRPPAASTDVPSQNFDDEERKQILAAFQLLKKKPENDNAGRKLSSAKSMRSSRSKSSSSSSASSDGALPEQKLPGMPSPSQFKFDTEKEKPAVDSFSLHGLSKNIFDSGFQRPTSNGLNSKSAGGNNFFRDPTPEETFRTSAAPQTKQPEVPPEEDDPLDEFIRGPLTDRLSDPVQDFSSSNGWGHTEAEAEEDHMNLAGLKEQANKWFSSGDPMESANARFESQPAQKPTYDFGSGEMDYKSFYSSNLPKYNFGN